MATRKELARLIGLRDARTLHPLVAEVLEKLTLPGFSRTAYTEFINENAKGPWEQITEEHLAEFGIGLAKGLQWVYDEYRIPGVAPSEYPVIMTSWDMYTEEDIPDAAADVDFASLSMRIAANPLQDIVLASGKIDALGKGRSGVFVDNTFENWGLAIALEEAGHIVHGYMFNMLFDAMLAHASALAQGREWWERLCREAASACEYTHYTDGSSSHEMRARVIQGLRQASPEMEAVYQDFAHPDIVQLLSHPPEAFRTQRKDEDCYRVCPFELTVVGLVIRGFEALGVPTYERRNRSYEPRTPTYEPISLF